MSKRSVKPASKQPSKGHATSNKPQNIAKKPTQTMTKKPAQAMQSQVASKRPQQQPTKATKKARHEPSEDDEEDFSEDDMDEDDMDSAMDSEDMVSEEDSDDMGSEEDSDEDSDDMGSEDDSDDMGSEEDMDSDLNSDDLENLASGDDEDIDVEDDEFDLPKSTVVKDWMGSDDAEDQPSEDQAGEEDEDGSDLGSDLDEDEGDEEEDMEEEEFVSKAKSQTRKLILNAATEGLDNEDEDVTEGEEEGDIPNLSQINARIQAGIAVLSDWKGHAEGSDRPRSFYVQQLKKDLCLYFGYNDYLMDKLMDMFPKPAELHSFLEANEMERPVTIRCNTLKCKRKELAQALIARGVNLEPSMEKWNPYGLQVFESRVPIGATPEYLAGHYMLQAAASFLPVLALGIEPNVVKGGEGEKILDMCAAPGGKTTFVAALMRNRGHLFANDVSADRVKALAANVHRMGVTNCIVSCLDGRKLPTYMTGFDRILLDAPCSGTGVISKDQSVKLNKSADEINGLMHVQKELIMAAVESLAVGGTLVYSTCSILVEENEEIVDYVVRKCHGRVEVVDTTLPFGEPGFTCMRGKKFHPSMALTRRYYPHTHNLDGFYVARLRKLRKV